MSSPKVSVIVANYNHGQYVFQALDSLTKQTFQDFEIVVADDGSTDNSLEVIASWITTNSGKLQYPVKKVYLANNRGKWFALNSAIAQASGKLITLQDADDASCVERLERQIKCLESNGSFHNLCGFVHCFSQQDMDKCKDYKVPSSSFFNVVSHKEVVNLVAEGRRLPNVNHYYLGQMEAHGATCLFYKQLWEHGMKFLPGNMGLRCQRAEDSDFNTKMTLLLQKTSFLNEPLYLYRRGSATNGAFMEEL